MPELPQIESRSDTLMLRTDVTKTSVRDGCCLFFFFFICDVMSEQARLWT